MARELPHPPVRRRKIPPFKFLIPFVLVLSVSVIAVTQYFQSISYLLRPLWDKPPTPFIRIPHYYAPNISMPQLCQLHGWGILPSPRRIFDAVLFSNELDILEIRYHELLPYVDRFVILESNATFTGIPKSLSFYENINRFVFAGSKIVYDILSIDLDVGFTKQPFHVEAYHRRALNMLIRRSGIAVGDVLIMADADEIPSPETLQLLKWCDGIPPVMHLELKNYMDIKEFAFKMKAYSHADRVKQQSFLNPERIQKIICNGEDLFDMLPEEYTFRDLFRKMGPIPKSASAVHLPSYLIENAGKFKFLLPGGCLRKTSNLVAILLFAAERLSVGSSMVMAMAPAAAFFWPSSCLSVGTSAVGIAEKSTQSCTALTNLHIRVVHMAIWFVILEANATFIGILKSLLFYENLNRFVFAGSKIVYDKLSIRNLDSGATRC
ncbi:hypothetical protein PR202_gb24267 [Eleusine coracana subsp. coracana]|uniref:Uncharacterized protein n=1 Tax=Eleusine coracana subsp. coracana TaxID=191504 RepID=A0AAV5FI97_ELECO|nr:hypothetical protein PR202_gb24267 [Eleusine coracana subsp. coracana]